MAKRKKKIKVSNLFAYTNTVTMNGKELPCKWNFGTFARAEGYCLLLDEDLSAVELLELVKKADMTAIMALLYGAVKEANPRLNDLVFSRNYRHAEMVQYQKCIFDGVMNFLPDEEAQEEEPVYLNPRFLLPVDDELDTEDFNLFTAYYAMAKKHLNMTDSEIRETTARGIKLKLDSIAELIQKNDDSDMDSE